MVEESERTQIGRTVRNLMGKRKNPREGNGRWMTVPRAHGPEWRAYPNITRNPAPAKEGSWGAGRSYD